MATIRKPKELATEISVVQSDGEAMFFADSRIPSMQKVAGKEYVPFGDQQNDYPEYLLYLYNKSALHNAIINGKVMYILGNGFTNNKMANETQTWEELANIIAIDIETFGGFYLECLPKIGSNDYNFYHISYARLRTNENNSKFFYKKDWQRPYMYRDCDEEYPAFHVGIKEPSIFFYKEYRADKKPYPLPSYVGACNDIESSIETSKHTLTNAKTGWSASKLVTFYMSDKDPLIKKTIDRQINNAYAGAEGKKHMLAFVNDPTKKPTVEDLGQSDLTKENITPVQNIIMQNILTGHGITHGLLFGIQQEGKLGGATELKTAYQIFKVNYVNRKRKALENIILKLSGVAPGIIDSDPIGIDFSEMTIKENLSRKEIREMIGAKQETDAPPPNQLQATINSLSPLVANKLIESMTPDEIRGIAGLPPVAGGSNLKDAAPPLPTVDTIAQNANSVLTNLSGRQMQGISRIVRQFSQGKLTKAQAAIMLKNGFGFTDADVDAYLGIDEDPLTQDAKFSQQYNEIDVAEMFAACGQDASQFIVMGSQEVKGDGEDEMAFAFKTAVELTALEAKISDILKKDSKVGNDAIAKGLNVPLEQVNTTIEKLINDGVIVAESVGGNLIRKVIEPTIKSNLPEFKIMYSYEKRPEASGPELLATSRPFCQKMIALQRQGRMYSREDIQKISERLGYSVFNRSGGFWNNNGTIEKQCRHYFKRNIVIKKK